MGLSHCCGKKVVEKRKKVKKAVRKDHKRSPQRSGQRLLRPGLIYPLSPRPSLLLGPSLACPPPRSQSLQACLCLLPNLLSRGGLITGVVTASPPPLPPGRLLGDFSALLILLILSHVPPRHPLCSLGMHQLQLQIQVRLPWTTPHRACRRDSARSRRCPRRSSRTF